MVGAMHSRFCTSCGFILASAALAACWSATAAVYAQGQSANPIYDQLIQQGVAFGRASRKICPPTLPDGLNVAQQQQAIKKVLDAKNSNSTGKTITYTEFIDKATGINAPYVLLINDNKLGYGGPAQPGHSIDLWFVVYGKLDAITDPKFLKEQFQPDSKDRIDVLKATDFPKGVPALGKGEWFVHGQFMIMSHDMRVRVRGTAHAMETTNADSGILAVITDRRFDNNPDFPNEWRPVVRDANQQVVRDARGDPQLGQPILYYSTGGYIKATKLVQPADAIVVEYHLVYDEPPAWFGGKEFLRSKLYTKTQEDVRGFRRQVRDAQKEAK